MTFSWKNPKIFVTQIRCFYCRSIFAIIITIITYISIINVSYLTNTYTIMIIIVNIIATYIIIDLQLTFQNWWLLLLLSLLKQTTNWC